LEDVDRLFAKDEEAREGLGRREESQEKFEGVGVEAGKIEDKAVEV
jgi:hypothetical protein